MSGRGKISDGFDVVDDLRLCRGRVDAVERVIDRLSEEIRRREVALGDTRQGLRRLCGDFSTVAPRDLYRLRKWERWLREALDSGVTPTMEL